MSIISISGRIDSGKDTTGRIIQYLTEIKIDNSAYTLALFEQDLAAGLTTDWKIKKFAGKLKQIASILTGIPIEKFEDQEFKKTTLSEEWDFADNDAPDNIMTIRMFLQKLGTEAMRNGLHTNVWVNALFADYKPLMSASFGIMDLGASTSQMEKMSKSVPIEYPNWIITDTRFSNELQAVKDRGGITIRVVRPKPQEMFLMNATTVIDTRIPKHPSETALDDSEFDYEIDNSGTIEDLIEKVKVILQKENII